MEANKHQKHHFEMKIRTLTLFYILIFSEYISAQFDYDYQDDTEGIEVEEEKSDGEYRRELEKKVLSLGATMPLKNDVVTLDYVPAHMPYFFLDEDKQLFHASFTICLTWTDERLKWDPNSYSGIKFMAIGPYDIWSPKLYVVGSGNGVFDMVDHRPDRVKVRHYDPPLLITCPTYYIKVGCPLDLTNYPYDKHECIFILKPNEDKIRIGKSLPVSGNDELFAITIRENEVENRTTSGSFKILGLNDSQVTSQRGRQSIAVTVTLQRNAPYYYTTVTLPSILFAIFNVCASITIEKSYSASLFLINILFIGIFLQDMIEVLPLHYYTLPNQVIFWSLHLLLSIIGIIYLLIKEVRRRHIQDPIIIYKIPAKLDDWTTGYALRQLVSLPSIYIIITIFSVVMFFY